MQSRGRQESDTTEQLHWNEQRQAQGTPKSSTVRIEGRRWMVEKKSFQR